MILNETEFFRGIDREVMKNHCYLQPRKHYPKR